MLRAYNNNQQAAPGSTSQHLCSLLSIAVYKLWGRATAWQLQPPLHVMCRPMHACTEALCGQSPKGMRPCFKEGGHVHTMEELPSHKAPPHSNSPWKECPCVGIHGIQGVAALHSKAHRSSGGGAWTYRGVGVMWRTLSVILDDGCHPTLPPPSPPSCSEPQVPTRFPTLGVWMCEPMRTS